MALPAPNLDDRKFQDIVSEARSLIPRYCPEWTDHNLSDPGITFIELFAWMTDMLLYRLNQVPERNYIKFLDLIGLKLQPARPAKADVTFRLAAAQPETLTVPMGVEVATIRTETQEAITFTADRDLTIVVPNMAYCLVSRGDKIFHDYMPVLKTRDMMDIFQKLPQENDAFYLGFRENLAGNTLRLVLEASIEGIGVDPRNPPLAWEFWDSEAGIWENMRLELDATGGLNRDGEVILHVPYSSDLTDVDGKHACWVRFRVIKPRTKQPAYTASPRVRGVSAQCIGGTVPASHAFGINNEILGRSNGKPGQIFYLQNTPVLPRDAVEIVEIEREKGGWEKWQEVSSFSNSTTGDKHYVIDSVSGEIQFGPRIREPNGEEQQCGMIPPKGKQIKMSGYRCGGGVKGNVGERTLNVLKSSIPYIAWATNLEAARGGTDSENLDHAKLRAPDVLKARTRAVTADDFEFLACEASYDVARAKCVVPRNLNEPDTLAPGIVRILLVPRVVTAEKQIPKDLLIPNDQVIKRVESYLDDRRLLTVQLKVGPPEYRWISVNVKVKAKPKTDARRIREQIEKRLYQFINPISGGTDATGWPFSRDLFTSDISSTLQGISGVDYIEDIRIHVVNVDTGKKGEPVNKVGFSAVELPCSYQHQVEIS